MAEENNRSGAVLDEPVPFYPASQPVDEPWGPPDAPSELPAAMALGITVADVYAAIFQRLGPRADAGLALELTRVAIGSQLVTTLLTRKG